MAAAFISVSTGYGFQVATLSPGGDLTIVAPSGCKITDFFVMEFDGVDVRASYDITKYAAYPVFAQGGDQKVRFRYLLATGDDATAVIVYVGA